MADDIMMFRHDDGAGHFQHLPAIHPGLIRYPPVPAVHPVPNNDLPGFPVSEAYVTGFSECAEETIRYLREVEGLPHDDPFIVGLQQHLLEKQRFLQLSLFLQNNLLLRAHVPNDDCVSSATKVNSDTSTIQADADRDNSTHVYTCNTECNTDWHMPDHDNTINCVAEDSEQLVSNLVEELYSLLQGEDIDFDSDDEIDEGFDEMKEQEVFS